MAQFEFDEDKKEILFRSVYGGRTTPSNLPVWVYEEIANYLKDGISIGLGSPDAQSLLLRDLTTNAYYFSGAKTFQQVLTMQELLKDANGLRVPFAEFKKGANKVFEQYNQTWLKTEYNTAVGQSQMAQQWADIQRDKDIRPNLTYRTSEDERVCPICMPLDGFTAPVDSPIWNKIMPLNHYGCVCTVSQEGPEAKISEREPDVNIIPEDFQFNPGKYKEVFDADHPYFDVPPQYADLKAHNFNLPIPEQQVVVATPPPAPAIKEIPFTPATTIADATKYATEKLGMYEPNFGKLDLSIVNSLNSRIAATKGVFPELSIKSIGSAQVDNKRIKDLAISEYKKTDWYKTIVSKYGQDMADRSANKFPTTMRLVRPIESGNYAYSSVLTKFKVPGGEVINVPWRGMFFNENAVSSSGIKLKTAESMGQAVKESAERKWFTEGANSASYIMNHELGHEIDGIINFKNNAEFKAIFVEEHKAGVKELSNNLSLYGATAGNIPQHKDVEMIAESWAEYVTSKTPRRLATKIGDLMLREYYEKYIQGTGTTFVKWKEQAIGILRANN